MPARSTYTRFLPAVLWSEKNDASSYLARVLRVPEKVLTGIPIETVVSRRSATVVNAALDTIQVTGPREAARFRPGDVVTIEGTAERAEVLDVTGASIRLTTLLAAVYAAGVVRIADLVPGQISFRVDDEGAIGDGSVLRLTQGLTTDDVLVSLVDDRLLTLAFGLANGYAMSDTSVPVGVGEAITIVHGNHEHDAIDHEIDRLHRVFSPWRTRADFLPWLASWVALQIRRDWSEYQCRKLISQMAGIYLQRGQKRGLHTYLDIYAVTPAKPRVAVDDGDAVFRAEIGADRMLALHAIAHSHSAIPVSAPTRLRTAMLHPAGIDFDSQNAYFVADAGDVALTIPRNPMLWKMTAMGALPFDPAGVLPAAPIPMPRPIDATTLDNPTAVVVDGTDRCSVLDIGPIPGGLFTAFAAIYRFAPPAYAVTTVVQYPVFPAVHPVDMVLDGAGRFVVLDRGAHLFGSPPAGPTAPKIHVVSEGPLSVSTFPLAGVIEPTAIVMEPAGTFLVADAGNQNGSTPADLWRVDPAAGWAPTSLLGGLPAGSNPLVFPSGLAFESATELLVCDAGVRWGYDTVVGDPTYRYLAEDATLFRVDLSQAPPTISRVDQERKLVTPTKLKIDKEGRAIVTDRGESQPSPGGRNWRAGANEFGVVVLFSRQRPTTLDERNRIRRGVMDVVEEQKPGHVAWFMDY